MLFCIVAYNAANFSTLWTTARKINGVVAFTGEKLSVLLTTTQKNVRVGISPRVRNHKQIYIRVSIRGLGGCVS
jgi:uncharacterized alkaline shock family protein YloU